MATGWLQKGGCMAWTALDKSIPHKVQCALCDDKGGWRDSFGWHECPCREAGRYQAELNAAIAATKQPDRHCHICGGRGGRMVNKKWCKCECTKPTARQRKQQRQVQAMNARLLGTQQQLF